MADNSNIDPLIIVGAGLAIFVIFILIELGVIRLGRPASITTHTAGLSRPIWIDPATGIHELTGSRSIGGRIYPSTKEFGKGRFLPIGKRPMIDLFPINKDKLASGDPSGNVWLALDESDPFMQAIRLQLDAYSYDNVLLTLRVHALENENIQIRSDYEGFMKREAEWMGDVKKKLGINFVPTNAMGRPQFGGMGGD
jgi:hypothetical protein